MSKHKCPYNVCDGSGILPFTGKNGKVRNDVVLFCDCHPIYGVDANNCGIAVDTQGRRPGVTGKRTPRGRMHLYANDFDFPMSWSTYRSLCAQHGWDDPGTDIPPAIESHPVVAPLIPEYQYLDSLKSQMLYLQNKLNEHVDASLKASKKKGNNQYEPF